MMGHSLPVVCTVRVIYAFMAREDGDLTLNKGDIIKVHDNDGGWWKGTLLPDDTYGSFPSNFVELLNSSDDSLDGRLSPSRPQSQQRQQHSRQSSVDNSKFTKRKPVPNNLTASSTNANSKPTPTSSSTTSLPYPGSNNTSSVSLGATSRKNPQAVIGDSGLCSTLPGAFPGTFTLSTTITPEPEPLEPTEMVNEAVYNPEYAAEQQQRRNSANSALLKPSGPGAATTVTVSLSPIHAGPGGRHVANRFSMPNLAGDGAEHQNQHQQQNSDGHNCHAPDAVSTAHQGARGASGTRSASHLPRGVGYDEYGIPIKQEPQRDQNYSEDPQNFQPGMMPRSSTEYYSQQFTTGPHGSHASTRAFQQSQHGSATGGAAPGHGNGNNMATYHQHHPQPGYRHSIANMGASPLDRAAQHSSAFYPIDGSELSLENLTKHNRSQSAFNHPKPHGVGHGRSLSQANLRPEGGPAFDPYDHQYHQPLPQPTPQQQQQKQKQAVSAPMSRMVMGPRVPSPSIVIPQPKGRTQSSFAAYSHSQISPTDSSPTSGGTLPHRHRLPISPSTPDTADSKGLSGTPTTAGTSMSGASAFGAGGPRDMRRKSETARMPPSTSMTASTFTARKFSVDARGLLASASMAADFEASPADATTVATVSTLSGSEDSSSSESLEFLGTYTAKKPKTTLIRAFKQIINPKKVAEKDAIRNKNEHFAWIEMQKSLKRVSSPEPWKERPPFFTADFLAESGQDQAQQNQVPPHQQQFPDQDPFEVLKKCQMMRDTMTGSGNTVPASSGMLDFGPSTFVQVDKVARNVNQRGPHMTPQLLSQKYLTRPYSKSTLSKLRVLFVWVSENIRLEGGPTRDVSGGRYKLGPAGEHMAALAALANGESPSLRGAVMAPPAAVFMTGIEEYARGFLQEDSPELAQDVLTSRTCKTGEGFANLFAEMALAAGIDDVGVVKGYVKGPMDVFSKDIPPPNHAWNVVRIDGTYRFIDCCLASPFHPAHYPNRPQAASSFYFLTSPTDLVLSHFPLFLTYQYITPSISPQVFLQLPFVRPAFFDFGLSLPEFKKRTRLEVKDDEPVEVVIRIDGGGGSLVNANAFGSAMALGSGGTGGHLPGLFGGECLGKRCGEGVELRAEVEVMTADGKVVRKRALAQVVIWNPYQQQQQQQQGQNSAQQGGQGQLVQPPTQPGPGSLTLSASSGVHLAASIAAASNRPYQSHHCTGIRIAKIKTVLPAETVVGAGGVRKGVVHIYAGRKVENAPTDATPYPLALTLPIRHTGAMPRTPFSFVLPHFSPYEFYVKAPQAEMLYYPHTYRFSVLSLAAQAQASAASASAIALSENEGFSMPSAGAVGPNNSAISIGAMNTSTMTSPRHIRTGSASMNPLLRPHGPQHTAQTLRGITSASAQILAMSNSPSGSPPGAPQALPGGAPQLPFSSTTTSMGTLRGGLHSLKNYPYQHQQHQLNSSVSVASTSSLSVSGGVSSNNGVASALGGNGGGGGGVPRPERLVLRTQTNRIYKLVYDPLRQCHEAQVEVKERGIWECVRMDDGGKSRVGREGTGGVVIASWRCV